MATVPRLRDDVRIQRHRGEFVVLDREGVELFRLTEGGFALLARMDGISDVASVREDHEGLSEDELDAWIARLDEAGVLVSDSRAGSALAYLAEQGLTFRRPGPDRRDETRDDKSRREAASSVAPWWNYAVFLLNDGLVEDALDVLKRMAESMPGDVRVPEMIGHLEFILASERDPALQANRRDVTWAAFDAALREVLDHGACPRCGERFEVVLGGVNRCWSCGAGFSAWIRDAADDSERRKS